MSPTQSTRRGALLALLCAIPVGPVAAQTIALVVDSTADSNRYASIEPLPVLCTAAADDCTLREAIATANALCWSAPGGPDPTGRRADLTIDVPGIPEPTITLSNTFLPPVLCNLTLDGRGATIDGDNLERLFLVGDDGTVFGGRRIAVTLANLMLVDGRARGGQGGAGRYAGGGGAGLGGALFVNSHADVALHSVRMLGNLAQGGQGGVILPTGYAGGGGGMRGAGGAGLGGGDFNQGGGGGGGLGGQGGPGGGAVGGVVIAGGGGGLGAFATGGGATGLGAGGGFSAPQWWPGLHAAAAAPATHPGGPSCGGGAAEGASGHSGRALGAGATSSTQLATVLAGGGGCWSLTVGYLTRGGFGGGGGATGTSSNQEPAARGGFGGGGGGATASADLGLSHGGFGGGGGGARRTATLGVSGPGGFGGGAGGAAVSNRVSAGGFGGGGAAVGGRAGFGGGDAQAVETGDAAAAGGGGAGFGGGLFVRQGGTLVMQFVNAASLDVTLGNDVVAGAPGSDNAQAGQAAGSDAYVDLGSMLDLRLGAGPLNFFGTLAGRGGIAVQSTARAIVAFDDWSGLAGDITVRNAGLAQIGSREIDLGGREIQLQVAAEPAIGPLGSAAGPIRLGGNLTITFDVPPTQATRYRIAQGVGLAPDHALPGQFDSVALPAGFVGTFAIEPFAANIYVLILTAQPSSGTSDLLFAQGFEP